MERYILISHSGVLSRAVPSGALSYEFWEITSLYNTYILLYLNNQLTDL